MKNSNDTIVNRTRYLPACSAVPQPAAPPRAPIFRVAVEIWLVTSMQFTIVKDIDLYCGHMSILYALRLLRNKNGLLEDAEFSRANGNFFKS
jgi:hypothetical protein